MMPIPECPLSFGAHPRGHTAPQPPAGPLSPHHAAAGARVGQRDGGWCQRVPRGPGGDIPSCPQRKPTCLACYKFDTSDVPKVLDKYHNCGPSHHLAAKVRCPQCPPVSPPCPRPVPAPAVPAGDPAAGRGRVPCGGGGGERRGHALPARNVRLLPGTASLGGYGDTPGDTPGHRGTQGSHHSPRSVSPLQAPRLRWTRPRRSRPPPLVTTPQHRVTQEGPGRVPPSRLSPQPSKPRAGSALTALIPAWHRPCHSQG